MLHHPLGTYLTGYFEKRYADGILDSLMVTEVTFDEGGYEALTARYIAGTAEQLIEASTESVNAL